MGTQHFDNNVSSREDRNNKYWHDVMILYSHPNKSSWLFSCIHKIVGMNYPHHMLEFGRPIFSRCAIPVEMFRFFQNTNITCLLLYIHITDIKNGCKHEGGGRSSSKNIKIQRYTHGNQSNKITHTIQTILQHLLPSCVPLDIQFNTSLLHIGSIM